MPMGMLKGGGGGEGGADNAEKRMTNCWSGGFEKVRGKGAQIPEKGWCLIKAGPLSSLLCLSMKLEAPSKMCGSGRRGYFF